MHTRLETETNTFVEEGFRYLALASQSFRTSAMVTDADERIVWVSEGFTELTGYTVAESLGANPGSLLRGPETDPKTIQRIAASMEAQLPFEVEILNYTKQRRPYWVRLLGTPIRDASGRLTHYLATQTDVTERRREATLHACVLDSAVDALIATDLNQRIQTFNRAAERMLGWSAAEVVGQHTVALFHQPEEWRLRGPELRRRLAQQAEVRDGDPPPPDEQEWTFVRKDGSTFPVLLIVSPMRDPGGALTGHVGIVRDLTEQKRQLQARLDAERRQREADDRLRKIAGQVPGAVYQFHMRPDGTSCFPYASAGLRELFGVEPEDVRQDSAKVLAAVHPHDYEAVLESVQDSARALSPWGVDFRVLRADGAVRWIRGVSMPEPFPDGGVVWSGFFSDVTERREAEDQLSKLAAVVEQAVEGVVIVDEGGTIAYVNSTAEAMTGYSLEELIGTDASVFTPSPPVGLEAALRNGEAWKGRFLSRRKNGAEFHEEATVFPLLGAGASLSQARQWVWLKRDVTHEVLLEQARLRSEAELQRMVEEATRARRRAEEAANAKSDFLSSMSHEIRTPMNGIVGMTSLLLDTPLTSDQLEFATAIRKSSDNLLTIINDILEFSKMEAGMLAIERLPFNLEEALADALELLAIRAEEKGLELVFAFPADARTAFIGDAGRVRQILLNLVGNAIKFTALGYIHVGVTIRDHIVPGDYSDGFALVSIAVQDTGIGIPPAKLGGLFDKFTQVDSSTTRRFGGTGLGLAITKHLATRMDGSVSVESVPRVGTTFRVLLPLRVDSAVAVQPLPPAKGRVLLICPPALTQSILRRWCEVWGLEAVEAAEGPEALLHQAAAQAENRPYTHLVVCQNLLARHPNVWKAFPEARLVILGSPLGRSALANLVAETGAAAAVVRPVRPSDFQRALGIGAGDERPRTVPNQRTLAALGSGLAGLKILLVEDNPTNQRVGICLLEKLGCEVALAKDGREAVEAATSGPFDAILMDCQMPEIDGFEATRTIRLGGPCATTPIIAMTANAVQGDRERCIEAGMDDYLSKPVMADELLRIVRQWTLR